MGRGIGESITARARTKRYTNVSKTNQRPAFVAYCRKEVCMHPHAEKRVCTPTRQRIRTHTRDIPRYVLSFFLLGFRRPNLITTLADGEHPINHILIRVCPNWSIPWSMIHFPLPSHGGPHFPNFGIIWRYLSWIRMETVELCPTCDIYGERRNCLRKMD